MSLEVFLCFISFSLRRSEYETNNKFENFIMPLKLLTND